MLSSSRSVVAVRVYMFQNIIDFTSLHFKQNKIIGRTQRGRCLCIPVSAQLPSFPSHASTAHCTRSVDLCLCLNTRPYHQHMPRITLLLLLLIHIIFQYALLEKDRLLTVPLLFGRYSASSSSRTPTMPTTSTMSFPYMPSPETIAHHTLSDVSFYKQP